MKRLFTTLAFAFAALASQAQSVGINAMPAASAALTVDTTAASGPKGMLIPRMTQARRNAITSPATGLMVFQTDNTAGFYYYNGTAWTAVGGSGGGAKLELVATKIAATQTPANAQGSNTGDVIVFDNVVTTPALGSYSTSTNAYTVGAGQSGLYYVQVREVSADASPATNTVGVWFKIEITPNGGSSSFINATDVYGPYPFVANANFPSGLKGRGEITATVYLNAGDSFVIKGLSANSASTSTIKNDGSCKLTVVKLN